MSGAPYPKQAGVSPDNSALIINIRMHNMSGAPYPKQACSNYAGDSRSVPYDAPPPYDPQPHNYSYSRSTTHVYSNDNGRETSYSFHDVAAPLYPPPAAAPLYPSPAAAPFYPTPAAAYSTKPQYPNPYYAPPPPTTGHVYVPNAFDAGARFDSGTRIVIPPPPPGVAPNAAQIAAMQGYTVTATQKKKNFWY